jgi:Ca-activated chloride channel family protein
MMAFEYPLVLVGLVLPLGLYLWRRFKRADRLAHVFDPIILERLLEGGRSLSHRFGSLLFLLAISLMIVALARPYEEKGEKRVAVEGLRLLVGLDISGSMRSQDLYPNRLSFAKVKMAQFFDLMPSDEISVVAFAYSPFVVAPFSSDKETLKMMIEGIDDSYISMSSTDFMAFGSLAQRLLEDKDPKIVVLFSDGGDKEAIAGFAQILKGEGIDLYVVLVGTSKGAPVLDKEGKSVVQEDGTIAITQRNDALGKLAKRSGGAYVIGANGKEDIESLVGVIRSKYSNQEQGEVMIKEKIEYFYYPLALGVLMLLLSLSSLPKRRES